MDRSLTHRSIAKQLALVAFLVVAPLLLVGCGTKHVATARQVEAVLRDAEKKGWQGTKVRYSCIQGDSQGRHFLCMSYCDPGIGSVVRCFSYDVYCDSKRCQWQSQSQRP